MILLVLSPLCAVGQPQGLALPGLRETGKPSARVVIVHDPEATEAFQPRPQKILAMINRGLATLTGKPAPGPAWRSLVSTQEVVGILTVSIETILRVVGVGCGRLDRHCLQRVDYLGVDLAIDQELGALGYLVVGQAGK